MQIETEKQSEYYQMTYQELLDEFCKRRAAIDADIHKKANLREEIDMLTWATQALLEKIRDEREGPR